MSRWIEIPTHRILELDQGEWRDHYQRLNEEGSPTTEGERIYRVIRKADSKVFRIARFWPSDWKSENLHYLEEA